MSPIEPDYQPEAPAAYAPAPDWIAPGPLAPAWHTVVLIAGIVAISFAGAKQLSGRNGSHHERMLTYVFTAGMELVLLGWVYLGLRLKKVPFRSVMGEISGGMRTLGVDLVSAVVFWFGSLFVLGTLGLILEFVELAIKHQAMPVNGAPDATQQKTLHTLTGLAPSGMNEIAAWIVLCVLAGIIEEIVFRGYLQRQFTAWARGAVWVGVAFSALLFGCAHGYQGVRNMILLTVFGALFSLLTVFRRNIRAGMIAHAWQDLIAGLMLSVLHARHMI